MKKLLSLGVLSFIAFTSVGQDNALAKISNTNTLLTKKIEKEYVMMKNGLALHVKFGDTTTLSSPLKLNNGELVMPNGTIQMPDGTTKKLKEGEYIDIDGQMGKAKK